MLKQTGVWLAGIRTLEQLASRTAITGVERLNLVEEARIYTLPTPLLHYSGNIEPHTQAWADNFTSHIDATSPEVAVYRISECLISPNGAIMTFAGAVIQETLYPYARGNDIMNAFKPFIHHDDKGPPDDIFMLICNTTRIREEIFFGREHGEFGYFHWLHSVLPRAAIYKSLDDRRRKLLVSCCSSVSFESLSRIGWPKEEIMLANGNTFICDSVIMCTPMVVPDLKRSGGFFERCLYASRFLRSLRVGGRRKGRRIFISRKDALVRRLLNEELLLVALNTFEFEALELSNLSLDAQINLFAEADIVVSMHGAGLSNISFMEPGTKVIEILTPERLWPTYRGVAARSDILYFPYVAFASGLISTNDSDAIVDVAHCSDFVGSVVKL